MERSSPHLRLEPGPLCGYLRQYHLILALVAANASGTDLKRRQEAAAQRTCGAQRACGARSASAGRCGCGGARTSRGCYGRDAGPHASQEGVRVQRQPPVALATALIRIVPLPQPNAWWCTRSLNGRRCAPNISCCSLSLVNNEHITARA